MKRMKSVLPCSALVALGVLMSLCFPGCATNAGQSLMIDARQVPAVQYMPGEITAMLEDLGYQLVPDPDPVKSAERYAEYRMQFKARDAASTRIDVHIKMVNNVTGLHLYQVGEKGPMPATAERYRKLRKRVELQFGAENVSDTHPFLGP
jgi:hypothetical protein